MDHGPKPYSSAPANMAMLRDGSGLPEYLALVANTLLAASGLRAGLRHAEALSYGSFKRPLSVTQAVLF